MVFKVTHANHNSPMYVDRELLAAFYHSPAMGCTHLVMTGGAVLPVKETLEQVRALKESVEMKKEETNVGNQ